MQIDDREILSLIRKDDLRGYELAFRKYYAPMWQSATAILRSKEAAEDVVQQLFLKLCRENLLINVRGELGAYLSRAARNASINYKNQYSVSMSQEITDIFAETDTPETILERKDLSEELERHLESLPPKCQSVFRDKYLEGKSYKEIAREQNISLATVDSHLTKAVKLLRKRIFPQPGTTF